MANRGHCDVLARWTDRESCLMADHTLATPTPDAMSSHTSLPSETHCLWCAADDALLSRITLAAEKQCSLVGRPPLKQPSVSPLLLPLLTAHVARDPSKGLQGRNEPGANRKRRTQRQSGIMANCQTDELPGSLIFLSVLCS